MSNPSLNPAEVLRTHQELQETRIIDSVVPEPTDLAVDSESLLFAAEKIGIGDFYQRGLVRQGPRNMLEGLRFRFLSGLAYIENIPESADEIEKQGVDDVAEEVSVIDEHFRKWLDIPDDTETIPRVTLVVGHFNGKKPTDTNRHFDFKVRRPVISYKDCFEGSPEHASVYYPGKYRLPGRLTVFLRAMSDHPDPLSPIPLFKRGDEVTHIMPANTVCVEPWNACHSGPTDTNARRTQRGILVVTYNLASVAVHSGTMQSSVE